MKMSRVEIDYTEEQWEKWENKRKSELRKEMITLQKLGTRVLSWSDQCRIARACDYKAMELKKAKIMKKEETPSIGKFTYETHSLKETMELFDTIKESAPTGTFINWVNDEDMYEKDVLAKCFTPIKQFHLWGHWIRGGGDPRKIVTIQLEKRCC